MAHSDTPRLRLGVCLAAVGVLAGLTACGSGGDGTAVGPPLSASTSVAATGGTSPTAPTSAVRSTAPTVSPDAYAARSEGSQGWFFITPSGRWRCAIVPRLSAVGCQPGTNTGPSIGVAGEPAAVPNPVGTTSRPNAIWIQKGRTPEFTYRGQADFWRFPLDETPVLPYGQELAAGGFACNTAFSGTSCVDRATGNGFTFSDAGYSWSYTPVGATARMAVPSAAPVDFTGMWMGHGRQVDLRPDGSATVVLADGAANTSKWYATWRQAGESFRLVFTSETARSGDGAGAIGPGTSWTGSLTTAEGARVLVFSDAPTIYWCRYADTASGVCGA